MKVTYFQLKAQLEKKFSPVYIISGEELLLKQDALNWIRKAAKSAGFHQRIRVKAETTSEWEQLYSQLFSLSLFTEKQLIELDFRENLPNKIASNILQEYSEHPPAESALLIDVGKIDDKIAKSTWYKALEKIAIIVTLWPISREQLPKWIIERASKYKLQFEQDAAHLLADYVEGNLIAAAQALEKLYLLQPQQKIDIDLITTLLTNESRFTIFDFVENLIAGNATRTLHILSMLKAEGVEPILILWGIARELRLLTDLSLQLKEGLTYSQLFQKHRIFAHRQSTIRLFLTRFSVEDCERYLLHIAEIDQVIKGVLPGNVWDFLQLFCLRISEPLSRV